MATVPNLLRACDVLDLAGETVFYRGANPVALGTTSGLHDGGRYPDVLAFLHGYASQPGNSVAEQLSASWSSAGGGVFAWEVGIDNADRIFVRVPTASLAGFTLSASAGNCWGFASGSTASSTVGAYQSVTAPNAWTRGNQYPSIAPNVVTISAGTTTTSMMFSRSRVHSIPTALRPSTSFDGTTSPLQSLETFDNLVADAVTRRVRWGVDSTGRVWVSSPTVCPAFSFWGAPSGLAWRRLLGFTGDEVGIAASLQTTITATYPCPLVLMLYRGLTRYQCSAQNFDGTVTLADGRARGRHIGSATLHDLSYTLRGPTSQLDQEGQALASFWPGVGRGQPCSLQLDSGDPRRHRWIESLYDGTAVPQFSADYTTQHLRGRVVARVAASSADVQTFALDGARVRSGDVSLTLAEEP
jgi:hypothetical protein